MTTIIYGGGGGGRGIRAQGSSGVHVGARASCSQTKYAELLYEIYDRKRGRGGSALPVLLPFSSNGAGNISCYLLKEFCEEGIT